MIRFTKIHFDGSGYKNIPFPKVTLTPERQRALKLAQDALTNKPLFYAELEFRNGKYDSCHQQDHSCTIFQVHPSISADRQYMGYDITLVHYIEVSDDYEFIRECKDQRWRQMPEELHLQQQQMDTILHGDALISKVKVTRDILTKDVIKRDTVIALSKDALLDGLYDIIEPL